MNLILISILTFIIAILIIATLYVTQGLSRSGEKPWYYGLIVLMGALIIGSILIFVPVYSRYAALVGITGVFIRELCACWVVWRQSKGIIVQEIPRRTYAMRAAVFVAIAGIIAAPIFVLMANQSQVKTLQYGIFGQLRVLESKVDRLIEVAGELIRLMKKEADMRQKQVHIDSVQTHQLLTNQNRISTDVKEVKADAKATKRQVSRTRQQVDRQEGKVNLYRPLDKIPTKINLKPNPLSSDRVVLPKK